MNGRVYDPSLGRFISSDPIIQDSGNSQNLNRYSYVSNSPMGYTDPSGYISVINEHKKITQQSEAMYQKLQYNTKLETSRPLGSMAESIAEFGVLGPVPDSIVIGTSLHQGNYWKAAKYSGLMAVGVVLPVVGRHIVNSVTKKITPYARKISPDDLILKEIEPIQWTMDFLNGTYKRYIIDDKIRDKTYKLFGYGDRLRLPDGSCLAEKWGRKISDEAYYFSGIYAVNEEGFLYAAPSVINGQSMKHSILLGGEPSPLLGDIIYQVYKENGKWVGKTWFSNRTGHYEFKLTEKTKEQGIMLLQNAGLLDNFKIEKTY